MRSIGIHEDWTATPAGRTPSQVRQRYPRSGLGRCFTGRPLTIVQDLRAKVFATLKPYLDAGVETIYISIKTDINQTLNGDWNGRYKELGVYLTQLEQEYGVRIVVIPWHEPENDFLAGKVFVKYYNIVQGNIKISAPDIKIKPCFMTYHWAPGSGGSVKGKTNTPGDWFNGLRMDDGVLADVYGGRSFKLEQTLLEHPGFVRWLQYLPLGVLISIGERGWETPSSTFPTNRSALRASTMRREFDWLLSGDPTAARIEDYMIWSSPGNENAAGLILDTAAEAEIDRLLSMVFTDQPLPGEPASLMPDTDDPQYQFGFAAGHAAALGEICDWASHQLADDVEQ